uniref:Secreted protein n=1 Tax=Panagrellus redivivus TaxID=6233 RepID=A0A7E4VC14_PANRE
MSRLTFYAVFSLTVLATVISSAPLNDFDEDDEIYNPNSRDFTSQCVELAEFAGPKACDAFWKCCSVKHVLNPLNGDKCQNTDHKNGCTLNRESTGIEWSSCKAHNCTAEVTTTTTTTTTTTPRAPSSVAPGSAAMSLVATLLALIAVY